MAATKHARARLTKYLGTDLPWELWRKIAENARAGLYTKERPRKVHPRQKRKVHRRQDRKPNPAGYSGRAMIFHVPLRGDGWVKLVPMAINTTELLVITVLPPGKAGYQDA